MRIAYLVCAFPPYKGGMGNSAKQLAALMASGQQVTVFTPDFGTIIEERYPYSVVRLKSLVKFGNAAWLPQLFWILRSFDVIHLHYPFYGVHKAVFWASVIWRKPLVLHYHMDSIGGGLKGLIFKINRYMLLPLLLRRSKVIIGSTLDYLKNSQIAAYVSSHLDKCVEIPFWISGEIFNAAQQKKYDRQTLLFVGGLDRAHYFKGVDFLLETIAVVKLKTKVEFILEVVGSGDLEAGYKEKAQELGISQEVFFRGNLSDADLRQAYRRANLLILPSINQGEAFGLVLLEAMSNATPVLASNLPGVRSVFSDGEQGYIFNILDKEDLVRKIIKFIENPETQKEMSRKSMDLVKEKYTANNVKLKLESVYKN